MNINDKLSKHPKLKRFLKIFCKVITLVFACIGVASTMIYIVYANKDNEVHKSDASQLALKSYDSLSDSEVITFSKQWFTPIKDNNYYYNYGITDIANNFYANEDYYVGRFINQYIDITASDGGICGDKNGTQFYKMRIVARNYATGYVEVYLYAQNGNTIWGGSTNNIGADSILIRFRNIDLNISDYKAFNCVFYSTFRYVDGYSSYQPSTYYVTKPFVSLEGACVGVGYPLDAIAYRSNGTATTTQFNIRYLQIDYDYSVKIAYLVSGSTSYQTYTIGYVKFDSNGTPYLDYSSGLDFYSQYSGIYYSYCGSSAGITKWLGDNSAKVYNISNNDVLTGYVDMSGTYYFDGLSYYNQWQQGVYLTNATFTLTFDFNIDGNTNSYNKVRFAGSTSTSNGGSIGFYDSNTEQQDYYYSWGSSATPNNEVYKGLNYGVVGYGSNNMVRMNIISYISVGDYVRLYTYLKPVSISTHGGGDGGTDYTASTGLDSVFTLIASAFDSVGGILLINVLPNISLLTIMLVPFAVFIILAILKALRE